MIHGLMMAAAIDAAAPNEVDVEGRAPEAFGRAGTVVLGEIVGARASSLPNGGLVGLGGFGSVTAAWLSFGSTRNGDTTVRSITAEPSFDVFVADGISLGGILGGGITSYSSDQPASSSMEHWHLTAMPRIGDSLELAKDIALWPRFAAGVTLRDDPGAPRLATAFRATFDVPFVFGIARHVALQVGPHVSYVNQLSGPPPVRGFSGGASAGLSILL